MKNKKLYVVILSVVLAVCMILTVACQTVGSQTNSPSGSEGGSDKNVTSSASGPLRILKSDLKLTQDQIASKIKAEYLLENKGYKDNDEVVVIIGLPGDALIDSYNKGGNKKYSSLAEYALSSEGRSQAAKLERQQDSLISTLNSQGYLINVKNRYTTIMNGVAVTIKYGKLDSLQKMGGVASAMLSETFNRPQAISGDANTVTNLVDVYETGIFNSGSVKYTGKKTAVAVLDSGFDISHEAFNTRKLNTSEILINEQDVADILPNTNAAKLTPNLTINDVRRDNVIKVPYAYDYADKDPDVYPYDSSHGTHVAGIIGGYSETRGNVKGITGVAIDTQLVLMKVFPDFDDGGKTEDILAALEDAVLLKVDAINMSLGSACGFTRDYDNEKLNQVYKSINDAGISLLTAASNSYSSGFGGEQGNTNFVTNPDSGTVGSPSTYPASLSVASISGTKSDYLITDTNQVMFFSESNDVTGKPNNFVKELYAKLQKDEGETIELDYVVVPGAGLDINYSSVNVEGKIAVVRRGNNTFEEKAMIAMEHGAVACIIYNNIDGDILMSMGKKEHIPTISISKDNGSILEYNKSGKIVVKSSNKAGPFMSDFSSWGPTPSLELKPEITAHGGNIYSAVPNGGYDEMSGTSMATPNLCGIVVLIRQYLREQEQFKNKSWKEISDLANSMLMSTATIVLNEEGNPYSPRKQGAGLASLYNVVHTSAYLSVDGKDRPKLELKDDPKRTGVYEMEFNVENIKSSTLYYDLSFVGMTESVSTSDKTHVAETPQILSGNATFGVSGDGQLNGSTLTVKPNGKAKVKVTYVLSDADKNIIETLFPYGMYVEGFVKLTQKDAAENINLNIPFLGFYGDWTQAPLFDKTHYEVDTEKYDSSIEEEDKLKADYFATTPYGSYFYNYMIPLGSYLYDVDTSMYDEIPASLDHIAVSNILGTIDGISCVYAGLLRCAKEMQFTIVDKVSGELVWGNTYKNATKAHSLGGGPVPYFEYLRLSSRNLELVNNRQYEFKMQGLLDYGDGGVNTNVRSSFSFDFFMDDEAPILKDVSYDKEYDEILKKDRYYITMTVYDNHYVQSIMPVRFTSSSSYSVLSDNPIPVYGERGQDCTVRFEITSYLDDLFSDKVITSGLAFSIDDYALNSNIYICQLPGTKGDFKFTKDGDINGTDLLILPMYEGEIVDITRYLATADKTVDASKDYLKHLVWTSSNVNVADVRFGQVACLKAGRTTITAREGMEGRQAVVIINVKERPSDYSPGDGVVDDTESSAISQLRFAYYETLFAYSRAAQTSEIGSTGDKSYISAKNKISFYPGERVKLISNLDPWYAEGKYQYKFTSTNPSVASVNENGEVTGLKEGSATVVLSVNNSTLRASISIEVKNPFVIENRTLIAYKGLGGRVVIPDDEGILYIGAYAFCLYETDNTFELPEDDYDANKIPSANTSITSVVIPYGVEEIQKYAFYNCTGLKEVTIPSTVKNIRDFAFGNDKKLETIVLTDTKVETIGRHAFENCQNLQNIDLSRVYAIAEKAFYNSGVISADLTALRNTGKSAFENCANLKSVTLGEFTKLSYAMFAGSGLTSVIIKNNDCDVPTFCFAKCENLESVTIEGKIQNIQKGAFSDCYALNSFTIGVNGRLDVIGEQAFYNDKNLERFVLPDNDVTIKNHAFYKCVKLSEIEFKQHTKIVQSDQSHAKDEISLTVNVVAANFNGHTFDDTALSTFTVNQDNPYYQVSEDGKLLLTKDGTTVVLAVKGLSGSYTVPSSVTAVAQGAFSGTAITDLTFVNPTSIGDYAFAGCSSLTTVNLPSVNGTTIGNYAFSQSDKLTAVNNLDKVREIGRYAFSQSAVETVVIGDNAKVYEGAFLRSKVKTVTIGANAQFGYGAFQECRLLQTVNMPSLGGVYFGKGCFSNDSELISIDLSSMSEISEECFFGCSKLREVTLNQATKIGKFAFADCATLSKVVIPVVKEIGEGAFARYSQSGKAPSITEIVLPDSLTKLGTNVFSYCLGLQTVTLPDTLEEIPEYTFTFCENLTEVIGNGLKTIGKYAFSNCIKLSKINLSNVTEVADYAFTSCTSLKAVDLSDVESIGYGAFASSGLNGTLEMQYLTALGDFVFQNTQIRALQANSLRFIGEGAFENCRYLTEFVFSANLEQIKTTAFYGCTSLKSFYYYNGGVKTNDGIINDYAKLSEGVLYTKMDSGKYKLTSVPAKLVLSSGETATTLAVEEGTTRIEAFAGNANEYIEDIILPDSLRIIGNYAFYGYKKLASVEFRSVTAPALEDFYKRDAVLEEDAPGFDILHQHYDVFGYELCYFNFVDQVGKGKALRMILPSNTDLQGYDSVTYQAYFGTVENAVRSDYVAMEKALVDFIRYSEEIAKLDAVKLTDETLINNALSAYNAITQNASDYGIRPVQFQQMIDMVQRCKQEVVKLKISNSTKAIKDVQAKIESLPSVFSISSLQQLKDVYDAINSLTMDERSILDTSKYNALLAAYDSYRQTLQEEIAPVVNNVNNTAQEVAAAVVSVAMAAAAAVVLKRKML